MKNSFKCNIGRVFAFTLAISAAALAQSQFPENSKDAKGCSARSLTGDYGMKIEGTLTRPDPVSHTPVQLSLRTLVLVHFDGHGSLSSVDHVVLNGIPPTEEWRPNTGTYTINRDCTGLLVFEPGINLYVVIVKQAREFMGVVNGDAITAIAQKVD